MVAEQEHCGEGCAPDVHPGREDAPDQPADVAVDGDLRAFAAGDDAGFTRIVERFTPRLRAKARRYGFGYDDSSDIIQRCWSRVYAARSQVTGLKSFVRWLDRIARNACVDVLRHEDRERSVLLRGLSESEMAEIAPTALQPVLDDEPASAVIEWLAWELQRLPRLQRAVAVRRWLEDKSIASTADELGVAAGTVKAALHQARRTLRRRLLDHPDREALDVMMRLE